LGLRDNHLKFKFSGNNCMKLVVFAIIPNNRGSSKKKAEDRTSEYREHQREFYAQSDMGTTSMM